MNPEHKKSIEAKILLEEAAIEAKKLVNQATLDASKLIKDTAENITNIKIISNDLAYVRSDVSEIKLKMESTYITRQEFQPVQRIVYGLIAVLGLATLSAIFKLIFIK